MNNNRLNFRYVIENEVFDVLAMDLSIGSVNLDLKGKYNEREAGEPFKTALCGVKGHTSRTPASSGFKALIPVRHALQAYKTQYRQFIGVYGAYG